MKNNRQDLVYVRTCANDHVCSTIDTIGRNFILVNLAIPFFFFYKFDMRFRECWNNLIEIYKKKIKLRKQKL